MSVSLVSSNASKNLGYGDVSGKRRFGNGYNGNNLNSLHLRPQQTSSTNLNQNRSNVGEEGEDFKVPTITIQNSSTHMTTYADKAKSSALRWS
ncbi:unnamed protein product [Orchesella dallaii]|uniref:Uncharacterized protein n=1 Tax=Orchesella dallaii TaxID=48710 RepID=A0ABP1R4C8_9HEXA